jgi:hypothetical protein
LCTVQQQIFTAAKVTESTDEFDGFMTFIFSIENKRVMGIKGFQHLVSLLAPCARHVRCWIFPLISTGKLGGPWSMIKTHDSIQDFAFENTF